MSLKKTEARRHFQPQTVALFSPRVPVIAQQCARGDIFLMDLQVTEQQRSDHKTRVQEVPLVRFCYLPAQSGS